MYVTCVSANIISTPWALSSQAELPCLPGLSLSSVAWLDTQPVTALANELLMNATPSPSLQVVERKTLRLHMPTAWAVIKNFHK